MFHLVIVSNNFRLRYDALRQLSSGVGKKRKNDLPASAPAARQAASLPAQLAAHWRTAGFAAVFAAGFTSILNAFFPSSLSTPTRLRTSFARSSMRGVSTELVLNSRLDSIL
jgi:hypothetical protein